VAYNRINRVYSFLHKHANKAQWQKNVMQIERFQLQNSRFSFLLKNNVFLYAPSPRKRKQGKLYVLYKLKPFLYMTWRNIPVIDHATTDRDMSIESVCCFHFCRKIVLPCGFGTKFALQSTAGCLKLFKPQKPNLF